MKLIDLTRLLDPQDYERLPEIVRPSSVNNVPRIEYISPIARQGCCLLVGLTVDQLSKQQDPL
jgi:hypothetical protein